MTAACSDENELIELADGLLSAGRHDELMRHVDACSRCRTTLAALVRDETETSDARPRAAEPSRVEKVPVDLLRDYLRREAPARELKIARFVAASMVVLLLVILTAGFARSASFALGGALVLAVVLAYEVIAIVLLRRGWFHPQLPLVSSIVEISVVFGVELVAVRTAGSAAFHFPGAILLGALVVFSALRAEPRLCLVVGTVAAVQALALAFLTPVISADASALGAHLSRAMFCLISGLAGATLARDLVDRAENAMREIREQDLFGKYLLHERLGRGGMGEVLRATYCPEGGFVRTVAVKRVRPELSANAEFIESFRSEVQLGSTLVHPNLVQMLDCGRFRGAFVVVMELVDGASLATVIDRLGTPLPLAAVTYVGAELAAALEYLHGKRGKSGEPLALVHRDVNPPNVLVSRIGEVKLADFGVARAAPPGEAVGFAGKTSYAAPEQLRGESIDGRTDLFALGLLLHEALTGKRAIPIDSTSLDVELAAPSTIRREVPAALDAIVMDLLAQKQGDRPSDAAQVRRRLLALEGACAPYPRGEELLAQATCEALSALTT